jgi:hypothetical protein
MEPDIRVTSTLKKINNDEKKLSLETISLYTGISHDAVSNFHIFPTCLTIYEKYKLAVTLLSLDLYFKWRTAFSIPDNDNVTIVTYNLPMEL